MTETYVSTFDKRRGIRVTSRTKKLVTFEVDRRLADKRTGEVKIDVRIRETTPELFTILIKAYKKQ